MNYRADETGYHPTVTYVPAKLDIDLRKLSSPVLSQRLPTTRQEKFDLRKIDFPKHLKSNPSSLNFSGHLKDPRNLDFPKHLKFNPSSLNSPGHLKDPRNLDFTGHLKYKPIRTHTFATDLNIVPSRDLRKQGYHNKNTLNYSNHPKNVPHLLGRPAGYLEKAMEYENPKSINRLHGNDNKRFHPNFQYHRYHGIDTQIKNNKGMPHHQPEINRLNNQRIPSNSFGGLFTDYNSLEVGSDEYAIFLNQGWRPNKIIPYEKVRRNKLNQQNFLNKNNHLNQGWNEQNVLNQNNHENRGWNPKKIIPYHKVRRNNLDSQNFLNQNNHKDINQNQGWNPNKIIPYHKVRRNNLDGQKFLNQNSHQDINQKQGWNPNKMISDHKVRRNNNSNNNEQNFLIINNRKNQRWNPTRIIPYQNVRRNNLNQQNLNSRISHNKINPKHFYVIKTAREKTNPKLIPNVASFQFSRRIGTPSIDLTNDWIAEKPLKEEKPKPTLKDFFIPTVEQPIKQEKPNSTLKQEKIKSALQQEKPNSILIQEKPNSTLKGFFKQEKPNPTLKDFFIPKVKQPSTTTL